ncbi:MAG: pseudouridine synthase [Cardiobacteriaceae bacterium]|nr:pseudouridine synthase [Cardiobacteriaceae bacterium]
MIEILYQNEDCVVVNKPAGMLMHRSFLDVHETTFLLQTVRNQIGRKVYPVHRLDRPTSGAVLLALSSESAHEFAKQFQQNEVQKVYLAVVRGWLSESGTIDYPLKPIHDPIADIHRDPDAEAQSALSHYACMMHAEFPFQVQAKHQSSRFSWLKLMPKTGRKHQLRRHLKHIFHPIIGDTAYGDLKQNRAMQSFTGISRLWLHAHELHFQSLQKRETIKIIAPLDEDWQHMRHWFEVYQKR